MTEKEGQVCLGAFAGAHGVKGAVKVKTFTETPDAVGSYGPVTTEDGARTLTLNVVRLLKGDFVLATAPEISSREDAESLKGHRFYVARDKLPPLEEDEFYLDDLIGLRAEDETGAPSGQVRAVHNFGAGDLIELHAIPGVKGVRLAPFTKENFPRIDFADGRIVVLKAALDLGESAEDEGNDAPE